MAWWCWLLLIFGIFILLGFLFITPYVLKEETYFISDKKNNYENKKKKIQDYIAQIRYFEINRDKTTLYKIINKMKIYQRLLGKFGYEKNFVKYNVDYKVKNFKVIIDSISEIKKIYLDWPNSKAIGKYCALMIEHLSEVEIIYNDLIDQLDEINSTPIKEYVYYLEKIIILPVTVLTYIFTRPFTIANGDFNIYDKLDINKGWQLARFILSILSEVAGIVSLIIFLL